MATISVKDQCDAWARDLRRGIILTNLSTVLRANQELAAMLSTAGYSDRLRAAENALVSIPEAVRAAAVDQNVAPAEFAQALGAVRPLTEEAVTAVIGLIVLKRATDKDPDLKRLTIPAGGLARLGLVARRQGEAVAVSSLYGKVFV